MAINETNPFNFEQGHPKYSRNHNSSRLPLDRTNSTLPYWSRPAIHDSWAYSGYSCTNISPAMHTTFPIHDYRAYSGYHSTDISPAMHTTFPTHDSRAYSGYPCTDINPAMHTMAPIHPLCKFLKTPSQDLCTQTGSNMDAEPRLSSSFSFEQGDLDLSDACFLKVDLSQLWVINSAACKLVMDFAYKCSRKSVLKLFSHNFGFPAGGILGWRQSVCTFPRRYLESYHSYALIAVTQYNLRKKDAKLRLEKLLKVNVECCMGASVQYYLTFSAISEDTGKVGTYQAAVRNCHFAGNVLGLFRDSSADKTLAIISIPGAEEYLAAKKKFDDYIAAEIRSFSWM